MALQIIRNKGTFYLNGNINFNTLPFLSIYLNSIEKNTVTLNINNLKDINKEGLNTIFVLLKSIDKVFYIQGFGNNELYKNFKQKKVA